MFNKIIILLNKFLEMILNSINVIYQYKTKFLKFNDFHHIRKFNKELEMRIFNVF